MHDDRISLVVPFLRYEFVRVARHGHPACMRELLRRLDLAIAGNEAAIAVARARVDPAAQDPGEVDRHRDRATFIRLLTSNLRDHRADLAVPGQAVRPSLRYRGLP